MIIKNTTKLNSEQTKKLYVNNLKGDNGSKMIFAVLLFGISIPILIFGIYDSSMLYICFGIAFLIMSLVYFTIIIIDYIKTPKRVEQQYEYVVKNGLSIDYTFKEQSFEYQLYNGTKKEKNKYSITDVKKVYNYPNNYIIYTGDGNSFIVGKDGFVDSKSETIFRKNFEKAKKKIKNKN